MTRAPVNVPALPTPAIARPTMNAEDEGAAAQRIEPASKITTIVKKVHLAGKNVCSWVSVARSDSGWRETNVCFAYWQLEGAEGEEVRGLVPGDVIEGVEFV